jgi:hypothetical protein
MARLARAGLGADGITHQRIAEGDELGLDRGQRVQDKWCDCCSSSAGFVGVNFSREHEGQDRQYWAACKRSMFGQG